MINTNKLRGLIAERGLSQVKLAKYLGMTPKTFYTKMGNGVFDSDEIEAMIVKLDIPRDLCMDIFFCTRSYLISDKKRRSTIERHGRAGGT